MTYRVCVYCGPTVVERVAKALVGRDAFQGTQDVYFNMTTDETEDWQVRHCAVQVLKLNGFEGWNTRDVRVLKVLG